MPLSAPQGACTAARGYGLPGVLRAAAAAGASPQGCETVDHTQMGYGAAPCGLQGVHGVQGVQGVQGVHGVHGVQGVQGVHGVHGVHEGTHARTHTHTHTRTHTHTHTHTHAHLTQVHAVWCME